MTRTIRLEHDLLSAERVRADENRRWLARHDVTLVNIMGAPGAGKTRLLETTIPQLSASRPVVVVEGDQATRRDAARLEALGAQVRQINTGQGCHLDAKSVGSALKELHPAPGAVCFVENVGNLVCPALFDLGEHVRVVVSSVTEGEDKPQKYPHMFRAAHVVVLNKLDLAPHVDFDELRFDSDVRVLNPTAKLVRTTATRPSGSQEWICWCREVGRANPPPLASQRQHHADRS